MKKEKQDDNNKEILKQTFLPSYLNTKDKNPSIHTGREIQHNLFFFLFLHSSFSTHVLLHPPSHTHKLIRYTKIWENQTRSSEGKKREKMRSVYRPEWKGKREHILHLLLSKRVFVRRKRRKKKLDLYIKKHLLLWIPWFFFF